MRPLIDLERLAVARADEQLERFDPHARERQVRLLGRNAADLDLARPAPSREPLRWCVGCGRRRVRGWRYCRGCRERLQRGVPVDVEDVPTRAELEAASGVPPFAFRRRVS